MITVAWLDCFQNNPAIFSCFFCICFCSVIKTCGSGENERSSKLRYLQEEFDYCIIALANKTEKLHLTAKEGSSNMWKYFELELNSLKIDNLI